MIVKNKLVKILLYVLEWIPVLGILSIMIIGFINVIDFYKGRASLNEFDSDHPDYVKVIFFRNLPLGVLNAFYLGVTSHLMFNLLFL